MNGEAQKAGRERDIWVVAEHDGGDPTAFAKELLGVARAAAGHGQKVGAVLLGSAGERLVQKLAAYGADAVYTAGGDGLAHYNGETCTDTLAGMVREYRPVFLLCGMTVDGRDLAARLAARLAIPLVSACVAVRAAGRGRFRVTRLACHGLAQETAVLDGRETVILAFPPGTRGIADPDDARVAHVISVAACGSPQPPTRHVATFQADVRDIDLTEAAVVVTGGGGMGDRNSFRRLMALGALLGAGIGGSRVAVDKGWVPRERLIGITGKTISPDLYLAFGISGATAHITGVKDCRAVIAVNTDPTAPIFRVADLGVVGDVQEILPILLEKLQELPRPAGGEVMENHDK